MPTVPATPASQEWIDDSRYECVNGVLRERPVPGYEHATRDLISERTREGLASARAKRRLLGRPKGLLGKSCLDGKEEEIRILLQKQVSKPSIAKVVGVTRRTIHRFTRRGGSDRSWIHANWLFMSPLSHIS